MNHLSTEPTGTGHSELRDARVPVPATRRAVTSEYRLKSVRARSSTATAGAYLWLW